MRIGKIVGRVSLAFFAVSVWAHNALAVYNDAAAMGDGSSAQIGGIIKLVINVAGLAGIILFVAGCMSAYNTQQMGGRGAGGGYGKAIAMCVVGVCLCTVYGFMQFTAASVLGGSDMQAVEQMGLGK